MNYVYSIQDPQLKNYFPELAKNLIALNNADLEIINGFTISKEIIQKLMKDLKLEDFWIESLSRLNVSKMQAQDLDKFSLEAQKRISSYQFDENLKEEISKAYSNISGFLDSGISIYQIVNSEEVIIKDLNIKGVDEIFASIKSILSNEFASDKVLENFHSGKGVFDFQNDFLVLKSIQPEVSGFAYNFELINNLKDKFTLEAIFGLNTLLENKSVIPDQYIWDLEENRVSEKFLSKQSEMEILVSSKEKTRIIPISKSWQDRQKLDDKYITKIVEKLKILDNEFGGRLFRLKWAFESGKIYGLGIEEFYVNLAEHKHILDKPSAVKLSENEVELTQTIQKQTESEKIDMNILENKENAGLNLFEKLFKTTASTKKVDEVKISKSIFDYDINIQTDQLSSVIQSELTPSVQEQNIVKNKKVSNEGKSAFEILYPNRIRSEENSSSNLAQPTKLVKKDLIKPIESKKNDLMPKSDLFAKTSLVDNTKNQLRTNISSSKISDIKMNLEIEDKLSQANITQVLDSKITDIKKSENDSENENLQNNKDPNTKTQINSTAEIKSETKKEPSLTEQSHKKISSNIKTATKVFLNLHGESNLNTSDILSSDGAIIGFDYKNLDIEGLSIVLSNNSQLYNPKPVIYQIGGLSKYTKYNEEIPLEVEKQFSSVLTARNLEGNKNLHVMINTIKTTEEYLNIKKFIGSIGLRRSSNFKIYLSLDNLAAFHNLQNILEDGVDGIFINLEELSKFAVGATQGDVFQIYDIETIGILNLLKDAVNFCSKQKVPVLVNISSLAGEKLEYNLKKILQLGIFGVQTSRSNLVNVKEILSKLELESLFK